MAYVVEVDQSNMVEESGDTYLAFSNDISWAIRVPFKAKQAGFEALRDRRKTKKTAKLMLFAACIFLLIEGHLDQLQRITIDNEYAGRGDYIKAFLLRHIWEVDPEFDPWDIETTSIGKKSPAHIKAWSARAEGKADRTVTTREILDLVG